MAQSRVETDPNSISIMQVNTAVRDQLQRQLGDRAAEYETAEHNVEHADFDFTATGSVQYKNAYEHYVQYKNACEHYMQASRAKKDARLRLDLAQYAWNEQEDMDMSRILTHILGDGLNIADDLILMVKEFARNVHSPPLCK